MKTATTNRIARALLAIIILQPPLSIPATEQADAQGIELVADLTPTDRALMDYGKARFTAAGLEYPEGVLVTFHDDGAPCGGQDGRFRHIDGVDRIWICKTHENPEIREVWRKRTLIHELAHVWESRTLDDTERAAFLELRELETWNDSSSSWSQRGAEHAAEILTWGLLDEPFRYVLIPDHGCDAFAEGYELLTGLQPLTGLGCD